MSALLIVGIETNPGPRLEESSNFSAAYGIFEKSSIKGKFSFVHYNIQSLSNKVDIIESELRDFDAICLTET